MRRLIVVFLLIFLSTSAFPQGGEREANILFGYDANVATINSDTKFFFVLSDQVTDGCWLTANRAVSMAKREFLDAGYTNIAEEYSFGVTVRMSVIGYSISDYQCAAYVDFEIGVTDTDQMGFVISEWYTVSERSVFELGALLTGPKTSFSDRINDTFAGYIDEFIVSIQQEKNRLRQAILETEATDAAKAEFLNAVSR